MIEVVDGVSGTLIPDLPQRLRAATLPAHQALEDTLRLLDPPLDRRRFLAVLQGFWGFHAGWEPALAAVPGLSRAMAGRFRLPLIEADLAALGMDGAAIAALPVCRQAAALCQDDGSGLGSIYVVEGSTLGGQLIGRALGGQAWLPPGGLRTFDPFGAETGARWREMRAMLQAASSPDADPAIIAGAEATFALLRDWLGRALAGAPGQAAA